MTRGRSTNGSGDPARLFAWRDAVASAEGPASPWTRLVLLTLSLHMDSKLVAYPSHRTLAVRAGTNKGTVTAHLRLAEQAGWLEVRVRRQERAGGRRGGAWMRHEYRGLMPVGVRSGNPSTLIDAPPDQPPIEGMASGATRLASGPTSIGVRSGRTELSKNSSGTREGRALREGEQTDARTRQRSTGNHSTTTLDEAGWIAYGAREGVDARPGESTTAYIARLQRHSAEAAA
jgi:hypothetical protein